MALSFMLFFSSCKKEEVEPKEDMFSPSMGLDVTGGLIGNDTLRNGLYIDKKIGKGVKSSKPKSVKLLISSN